jgi:hypothetical protein
MRTHSSHRRSANPFLEQTARDWVWPLLAALAGAASVTAAACWMLR